MVAKAEAAVTIPLQNREPCRAEVRQQVHPHGSREHTHLILHKRARHQPARLARRLAIFNLGRHPHRNR